MKWETVSTTLVRIIVSIIYLFFAYGYITDRTSIFSVLFGFTMFFLYFLWLGRMYNIRLLNKVYDTFFNITKPIIRDVSSGVGGIVEASVESGKWLLYWSLLLGGGFIIIVVIVAVIKWAFAIVF